MDVLGGLVTPARGQSRPLICKNASAFSKLSHSVIPARLGAVPFRGTTFPPAERNERPRLVADCKKRVARQREVIATAFQEGCDTEIHISMLRAAEASLRAFERHRARSGRSLLERLAHFDEGGFPHGSWRTLMRD
jgi:hypothetical protein